MQIKINEIDFNLGVDSLGKILFISTSDENFKINGVEYVGSIAKTKFENKIVNHILGWGNFVEIYGGWNIATDFGKIEDSSKIKFVFQHLREE